MSEVFPLAALAVPGTGSEVPDTAPVQIAERRPGAFVEIRLWKESPRLSGTIAAAAECQELPAPGRVVTAPGHMLLSAGPARYFAVAQEEGLAGRIAGVVAPGEAAVVDLTHGRVGLRIAGPNAERLLQKGLAFDLASKSFPPGSATTGAIHHMAVTVVMIAEETFDIFAMSSLAGSVWDWLTDSAVEYGWRVTQPIP
ncbi:sarcosine oxidase subunit gamma [Microbaculum marinum]|uniref:Sarcosine oxidase subunit gamma family protein n=1 Tax=Microbaculum marinum TaxID=1764581 RepID=A0AAW9RHT7_9HYPH